MGTSGNRFGPLGADGLGDKADRWGRAFDGARAIVIGSRYSVAIRTDSTLWAWAGGLGIQSRRLFEGVVALAAGKSATIAMQADGSLLRWRWAASLATALKFHSRQPLGASHQGRWHVQLGNVAAGLMKLVAHSLNPTV